MVSSTDPRSSRLEAASVWPGMDQVFCRGPPDALPGGAHFGEIVRSV